MNKFFIRGLLCGIPLTIVVAIGSFLVFIEFFYQDTIKSTLKQPDISVSKLIASNDSLFNLTSLETGDTLLLNYQDSGDVIFINFWATSCSPCIAEMPSIEKLISKVNDDRAKFYLISPEPLEKIRNSKKIQQFNLPIYKLMNTPPTPFQGKSVPRTYICHRGKIIYSHIGALDWNSPKVVELINKILATS